MALSFSGPKGGIWKRFSNWGIVPQKKENESYGNKSKET